MFASLWNWLAVELSATPLSHLSDRDLADIGVSRGDLADPARVGAHTAMTERQTSVRAPLWNRSSVPHRHFMAGLR